MFENCVDYQDEIDKKCFTPEELTKIDRLNTLELHMLFSYNFMDFDAFDEPLKSRFSSINLNRVRLLRTVVNIPLTVGYISLDDNLVSPFESENAERNYLFFETTDPVSETYDIGEAQVEKGKFFSMSMFLYLKGVLNVQARARYNMWDLLGDIGGFYDGLIIVASILFGAYGSFAFHSDLLGGTPYDDDNSPANNQD